MSIALDTSAVGGQNKTYSYTCTGSNLLLLVWVVDPNAGTSAVTYNAVSMTNSGITSADGNYLYYLINPATGAHNVVITTTSTAAQINSIAVSYTGVKQSGFPDSLTYSSTAQITPLTVSTTVIASNCWLINFGTAFAASSPSDATNKTQRQTAVSFVNFGTICSDSNGTVSTGSNSTIFTPTTQTNGSLVLSIAPVPVASSSNASFLLNFV